MLHVSAHHHTLYKNIDESNLLLIVLLTEKSLTNKISVETFQNTYTTITAKYSYAKL